MGAFAHGLEKRPVSLLHARVGQVASKRGKRRVRPPEDEPVGSNDERLAIGGGQKRGGSVVGRNKHQRIERLDRGEQVFMRLPHMRRRIGFGRRLIGPFPFCPRRRDARAARIQKHGVGETDSRAGGRKRRMPLVSQFFAERDAHGSIDRPIDGIRIGRERAFFRLGEHVVIIAWIFHTVSLFLEPNRRVRINNKP